VLIVIIAPSLSRILEDDSNITWTAKDFRRFPSARGPHSILGIAKQAFSQCWAIMSAFGLNPGDRAKLRAIPPDADDDPARKFFARRFLA
jgi:hypothetical protein